MIGLRKLCVGPKMTDAQFSNDTYVVFSKQNPGKKNTKSNKAFTLHSSRTRFTNMLHNRYRACIAPCSVLAWSNTYRLVRWNTLKGREILGYLSNKVNEREWNRAIFGHISSFSYGLLHCRVRGGADVVGRVHLPLRLDRLHCFHQAAAG